MFNSLQKTHAVDWLINWLIMVLTQTSPIHLISTFIWALSVFTSFVLSMRASYQKICSPYLPLLLWRHHYFHGGSYPFQHMLLSVFEMSPLTSVFSRHALRRPSSVVISKFTPSVVALRSHLTSAFIYQWLEVTFSLAKKSANFFPPPCLQWPHLWFPFLHHPHSAWPSREKNNAPGMPDIILPCFVPFYVRGSNQMHTHPFDSPKFEQHVLLLWSCVPHLPLSPLPQVSLCVKEKSTNHFIR